MKAVLHTGAAVDWVPDPERRPWALLPVGNRPVLEYWLEVCVAFGVEEVRIVLGEGADLIEAYAGEGEKWGVRITYSFLKAGKDPDVFPRRSPDQWRGDGLLYLRGPAFPLRTGEGELTAPGAGETRVWRVGEEAVGFVTRNGAALEGFLAGGVWPEGTEGAEGAGLEAASIGTPKAYYDLNMMMVRGGITRYLAPGYSVTEGSYVGFNVVIPPSCAVEGPVMIGNNTRLQPLSAAGPEAVIGNRVVVDSQTEIRRCVVLDGTYLGRNLDLEEKIVAGTCLIDPESGVSVDLEDPLLLGQVGSGPSVKEGLHRLGEKVPALGLWLVQLPLFAVLAPVVVLGGRGRFVRREVLDRRDGVMKVWGFEGREGSCLACVFRGLSLDRWLWLPWVLTGRLGLCGHSPLRVSERETLRKRLPRAVPGVIAEDLLLGGAEAEALREVYARQYLHERSFAGDLALLFRVLTRRLLGACSQDSREEIKKEVLHV